MGSLPLERQYLDQVVSHVKLCIKRRISKQETIDNLATNYSVDAAITRLVWERLEKANQEWFRNYEKKVALWRDLREKNSFVINSKNLVHRYIERCMHRAKTQNEIVDFLSTHCNIDAAATRAGWEHLEHENQTLMGIYYSVMFPTEPSDLIYQQQLANQFMNID